MLFVLLNGIPLNFNDEDPIWNFNETHLAAMSFYDVNEAKLDTLKYHPDPYTDATLDGVTKYEVVKTENNFHDNLQAGPSIVRLSFTEASRHLLGYDDLEYTQHATRGSFKADLPLPAIHIPNSLIVEIPSLGMLASYDGDARRRKPIVAILPNIEAQGLNITYQTSNPVMIDMNNANPILLDNIEIKITGKSGDVVDLSPSGCSISLVVDK